MPSWGHMGVPSCGHGRGLCALVWWTGGCVPGSVDWGHGEGPVCPRVVVVRTWAMGRGLCALVWWTGGCVPGSVDWGHGEGPVCPRVVDWWVCTW